MDFLNLPQTDAKVKLAFTDAASCARWISQFQLTDIRLAHQTLSKKFWELNHAKLPPLDRLKITEQLRETVGIVQSGYARKIVGKPLPLNEIEAQIFDEIVLLWEAVVVSYGHCLDAGTKGDSRHLALICQRCLRYTGAQIIENMRLSHQVDGGLWLQFFRLYRFSEEAGFATLPVLESLKLHPGPSSCADYFARILLIGQADPYEIQRSQFDIVSRWVDEWVSMVSISKEMPRSAKLSPPIPVDLDAARCVSPSGKDMRYLDTTELGKHLKIQAVLLEQGKPPDQLGLGELPAETCLALVQRLHRCWCEGKVARMFEARSISHSTEVCFGLPAVHQYLSGKPFSQPGAESKLSKKQHEEIRIFGRVISKEEREAGVEMENWAVQDETSKGFSLIRKDKGMRVSPGHIVGIKSNERFSPCVIRWVIEGLDGSVNMGLGLLDGRAEAVAVRQTGINLTVSTKYVQAALLHHGEKQSLVMPKGWYLRNRVVEIRDKDNLSMELKLTELLGKGADYERAAFIQL